MSTSLKENNKPLLVGLTGGIGSGKSIVAKIFESLGVPIFDADNEAKSIINNNADVVKEVVAEFGEVYDHGKLNANKMAQFVFSDKEALEKLNNIIHPKVKENFENWIEKNNQAPILIKEAAILIETGTYQQMDKIILVIAPEDLRIRRVMERDGVQKKEVLKRMKNQFSDEEKLNFADYILNNDEKELLLPQIIDLYHALKKAIIE